MRLFIAIPLSESVKERVVELQRKLDSSKTRMKLVEKENLHMTLRFIGEGEPDEWITKMDHIKEKPFEIVFDQLGAFPNQEYIRVIWIGCERVESLLNIHRLIGEGELSPHVTLARLKNQPDQVVRGLLDERITLPMQVNKIVLMKSNLTRMGPKYGVVHETNL